MSFCAGTFFALLAADARADGAGAMRSSGVDALTDPRAAGRSADLLDVPSAARAGAAAPGDALLRAALETEAEGEPPPSAQPPVAGASGGAWCAPDLGVLANDVCFAPGAGTKGDRRTLVVFLHGVISPDSGWQWNQQRGMAIAAKRLGFTVLLPRGRRGIGPKGMTDWWTWPTAARFQGIEDELFAEWRAARTELEKRDGKPFDEVFVMGFSNGAYYTTSLASRGRGGADGYAAFAGGSGSRHIQSALKGSSNRKPFFLGIASKDKTTVKGARALAKALKATQWPHRSEELAIGHAVADRHLEHALDFLRAKNAPASEAAAGAATAGAEVALEDAPRGSASGQAGGSTASGKAAPKKGAKKTASKKAPAGKAKGTAKAQKPR